MKLPLLSGRQVLAALTRLGFAEVHRKGSHIRMKHPDGRVIIFPFHYEVDRYTLKGALRDAEIELEQSQSGEMSRCGFCCTPSGQRPD